MIICFVSLYWPVVYWGMFLYDKGARSVCQGGRREKIPLFPSLLRRLIVQNVVCAEKNALVFFPCFMYNRRNKIGKGAFERGNKPANPPFKGFLYLADFFLKKETQRGLGGVLPCAQLAAAQAKRNAIRISAPSSPTGR
jgi:hypothetical protein